MGLVIERHPSDLIIKAKMIVIVDKKEKYKLRAGDKIDIPLSKGNHTISFSLNLIKHSVEIDYSSDMHLLVAYIASVKPGIYVQNLTTSSLENAGNKFCISSCMNGMCGTLFVNDESIKFQSMNRHLIELKIGDIRGVSNTMGNLSLMSYDDVNYTFVIPKADFNEIMDFIKIRVNESNRKMQEGFHTSFGIDGKIEVNEEKEEFHVRNGSWLSTNYKLDQILSYESSEVSKKADYLGGALVGNLLGGASGAVLGSLHAAGQGSKVEYVRMNLTIKTDKGIKALCVNFGAPLLAVERSSNKYAMYTAECLKFAAYMDSWKKQKEIHSNRRTSFDVPTNDVATELRKFKAMLDEGIIDEEDFKAKKKQLLDI